MSAETMAIQRSRVGRRSRRRATLPVQTELRFHPRGGYQGRGKYGNRPERQGPAHEARATFRAKPVHVTMRMQRDVRTSLRNGKVHQRVRDAMCAARARWNCRIVHFAVLRNHVHLLIEAEDQQALARAMKGFTVRLARRVNAYLDRKGAVFPLRYHAHVLETPREMRNALVYVLNNAKKHGRQRGLAWAEDPTWVDACSSAAYFDGWAAGCWRYLPSPEPPDDAPVVPAEYWLTTIGWRQYFPLIDTGEVAKA